MRQSIPILILAMAMMAGSCGNRENDPPVEIIPEGTMISLLTEMHLTDALLTKDPQIQNRNNNLATTYYPSVLEKYGVTRTQVDTSVRWYVRNPKIYKRIYDKVVAGLEQRLADIDKKDPAQ